MAYAAVAVMVVGAAVAAYGAYKQAEEKKNALNVQATNERNAATLAQQEGEEAKRRAEQDAKPTLDSFGAGAAGMGVVGGEGSPLLAELDVANKSELNATTAQYQYKLQERDKLYSSYLAKREANQISPWGAAGMSLLQSVVSAASSYTGGAGGGVVGQLQNQSDARVKGPSGSGSLATTYSDYSRGLGPAGVGGGGNVY